MDSQIKKTHIWSYDVMGLDQVAVGVQLTQLLT